jgi:hypothetical protein
MGDHHRPDYPGVGLLLGADAAAIALFVPLHVDGTQVFFFAVALVAVNALAALIHRRAGSPLLGRWSGLGAAIRVVGGSPQSARWAVVASVICVLGAGAADIGASSNPGPTATGTKTPVASPITPSSATPSPSTPSPSTPPPSVKVYDPTTGPASLSIGVERAYLTNRLRVTITGITWTRFAVSTTIRIHTAGDHVCVYQVSDGSDGEGTIMQIHESDFDFRVFVEGITLSSANVETLAISPPYPSPSAVCGGTYHGFDINFVRP